MSHERPAKRVRQACEQCRRKKSKCSGERPSCSTCWRLEQHCYYYGEPLQALYNHEVNHQNVIAASQTSASALVEGSPQNLDDRMVVLESTVNEILNTLDSNRNNDPSPDRRRSSPTPYSMRDNTTEAPALPLTAIIDSQQRSSQLRLRLKREIEAIGELYLKFCADQPLPLFPKEGFTDSLLERTDVTLFAIIAKSLRYKATTEGMSDTQSIQMFRDAAHSRIMIDVSQGAVGTASLQALCLIVLLDFEAGCIETASSLMALTSMLASNVNFQAISTLHESVRQETRCCYWSIILLQRLLGVKIPLAISSDVRSLPYPRSCSMPTGAVLRPEVRQAYESSDGDNGVMVFVMEMSEEWLKVMSYVKECLSFTPDASPWLTTSRYASALAGVMSIETRLQPLHRYKHVAFRDLTLEDLEARRQYWAPWLLSRFLYHTMICLLNHPLLVTLQLQAKGNDSELFRQQSSFYVARHVHWILHFIAFIEARGFRITDPVVGYCAGVVATIESQLIYSVDESTAQKKRRNIESCRSFICGLAPSIPSMTELDRRLGALSEVISATYTSNMNSTASVSVDLSRIRDILDICPPSIELGHRYNVPETTVQTKTPSDPSSSHWVRLSRRPSVDQPDESGPIALDTSRSRPSDAATMPQVFLGSTVQPVQNQELSIAVERPEFSADLFFNGISQDVSSWWNAFDTYDPDCPSF